MKVKIMQRSVYHKYAEVEIEIDQKDYQKYTDADGNLIDLQDYLHEREDLFIDKIDKAMSEANFEYGTGVDDYTGMTDTNAESEWRYEANGEGGHL